MGSFENGRIVRHEQRQRSQIMGGWHDRRMARLLVALEKNASSVFQKKHTTYLLQRLKFVVPNGGHYKRDCLIRFTTID